MYESLHNIFTRRKKKMATTTTEELPPQIVVIPLARSHSFNQRECDLTEPQKVGRPVDKKKISPHNLIFDCRVLSRNHALIWYENGKFFIQDTKSSNGTFVNDCRLSPSGEESTPRELATRDVVQFGVNVNVDKRVTHGCIIATIKLYVNGKELPGPDPDVQQIVQVVQTCLNKEVEFETKLASMQEALAAAHTMAKESMINIVKEDELLSRLEMLENQLHVYSRNVGEDDLKKQLAKAMEEKHVNTIASKEKVRLILQEKIDSNTRLSQVQRDYDKAEEECQKYKTLYEAMKQEHSQQMSKLTDQVKTMEKQKIELQEKMKEEKELALASQESIKSELERIQGELIESQNKLSEASVQLDIARQHPSSSSDLPEGGNTTDELTGATHTDKKGSGNEAEHRNETDHRNEDGGIPHSMEDPVQMTIVPLEAGLRPSSNEGSNDRVLDDELRMSRSRIEELLGEVGDLGAAKRDLSKQLETLKGQLQAEREKSVLQHTIHGNETITTIGSGPDSAHKELQIRESDLIALKEEKDQLLSRVSVLETENSRLEKITVNSPDEQSEVMQQLVESREESNELREALATLQQSFKESGLNSTTSSTTTLDPLDTTISPDPRIKVLSVITLASIAVALISFLIAYFF